MRVSLKRTGNFTSAVSGQHSYGGQWPRHHHEERVRLLKPGLEPTLEETERQKDIKGKRSTD